jgi:type I restriction enzyme S subunit
VKFITKGDLEDILLSVPKDESLDVFSSLNTISKKIAKNIAENRKLSELRDWLLPMLMNGQVVVG